MPVLSSHARFNPEDIWPLCPHTLHMIAYPDYRGLGGGGRGGGGGLQCSNINLHKS